MPLQAAHVHALLTTPLATEAGRAMQQALWQLDNALRALEYAAEFGSQEAIDDRNQLSVPVWRVLGGCPICGFPGDHEVTFDTTSLTPAPLARAS